MNNIFFNARRFVDYIIEETRANELSVRAMGLVYISFLSFIPLLAFSFSILRGFGVVETRLKPILHRFLSPLGDKSNEIIEYIMIFIDRTNFGVLGIIGLLILIYTVFSLINKIENSFNKIWKVQKKRSYKRRFSDYISIVLISPIIILAVASLTSSVTSNLILGKLHNFQVFNFISFFWSEFIPLFLVSLLFVIIYIAIPNTKVNLKPAIISGICAGLSWRLAGFIFHYTVKNSTKEVEIYSSLSVIIFILIWFYLNWLIVLTGAQLSYCIQNYKLLSGSRSIHEYGSELLEKLSLQIMYVVGSNYLTGNEKSTLINISNSVGYNENIIQKCIDKLINNDLLVKAVNKNTEYYPSRSIESIKLIDIVDSVRLSMDTNIDNAENSLSQKVDIIFKPIDDVYQKNLCDISLRDIIFSDSE